MKRNVWQLLKESDETHMSTLQEWFEAPRDPFVHGDVLYPLPKLLRHQHTQSFLTSVEWLQREFHTHILEMSTLDEPTMYLTEPTESPLQNSAAWFRQEVYNMFADQLLMFVIDDASVSKCIGAFVDAFQITSFALVAYYTYTHQLYLTHFDQLMHHKWFRKILSSTPFVPFARRNQLVDQVYQMYERWKANIQEIKTCLGVHTCVCTSVVMYSIVPFL